MYRYSKLILILSVLIMTIGLSAQDMEAVKKAIAILSSKEFAGRGYSGKGDSIAASYIAGILKRNKIKAFSDSYFQAFNVRINTFPGQMKLAVNGSVLVPGYDYLVSPSSNSIDGEFPVIVMDHNLVDFPEKFLKITKPLIRKSFLLVDTLNVKNKGFKDSSKDIIDNNLYGARGIIEIRSKNLVYNLSPIVQNYPKIVLQKNSKPENISTVTLTIENEYCNEYQTQNIAAFIPGRIDSFIVFTAHYDHLGEMGNGNFFPGANDNASGVAMVLELARYFSKNKSDLNYSIAFLFFSAKELGLLGSYDYVKNPAFPLSQIKFLVNLEMVGDGENGIKVVNGTEHKLEFDKLIALNSQKNYLPEIDIRGPDTKSDHYPFHQQGIKCFNIFTQGAYNEYHSLYDEARALPLSKFEEIFRLMVDFALSLK